MSPDDLKVLCASWDGSTEAFRHIVAEALHTLGVYQHELARSFQVADSTVSRWASGVARPHPRLQRLIVTSIHRRAAACTRPLRKDSAVAPRPPSARRAAGRWSVQARKRGVGGAYHQKTDKPGAAVGVSAPPSKPKLRFRMSKAPRH
jgi:hypothetical protein